MARPRHSPEQRLEAQQKRREYKASWAAANPGKCESYRVSYRLNIAQQSPPLPNAPSRRYRAAVKMLTAAKRRARTRRMVCTITKADIIIPRMCPLLGIPLFVGVGKPGPNSPSLDRIRNEIGYIPGNVWVISHRANSLKSNLTAEEIIQFGMRILEAIEVREGS